MRENYSTWFNVTAKYDSVNAEGATVRTTESYVLSAVSFTDAEAKATQELSGYSNLQITKESIAPFRSVLFSENDKDVKWYSVKVKLINLDEQTGKEKKTSVPYLVQASSTSGAEKNTKEVFDHTMMDYEITNVAETCVVDVFE